MCSIPLLCLATYSCFICSVSPLLYLSVRPTIALSFFFPIWVHEQAVGLWQWWVTLQPEEPPLLEVKRFCFVFVCCPCYSAECMEQSDVLEAGCLFKTLLSLNTYQRRMGANKSPFIVHICALQKVIGIISNYSFNNPRLVNTALDVRLKSALQRSTTPLYLCAVLSVSRSSSVSPLILSVFLWWKSFKSECKVSTAG